MADFISGKTANEVWEKVIKLLQKQEYSLSGRTGNVFELLHTFISIEEPQQKWIYNRIPPISIGYALAELVWIINGEEKSDIINMWNPSLEIYAGRGDVYHGAYGKRIRSHFGFDQIEKAYEALQSIPESRQVVIQIYDTKVDFPIERGIPQDEDIPCNICSLLKVRNGKLEWSQIMRSNDVLLGMPYNFVQFTGLQEILAGWLELDLGSYNHYSDSLHLYARDVDKIGIGQETEIKNNDNLSLIRNESERLFEEIFHRMKGLCLKNITEKEIHSLAKIDSGYIAYDNIMLIIGAYISQKKKYNDLTKNLIESCTNNSYVAMWERWVCRNFEEV
jgi:thymidylate synthase